MPRFEHPEKGRFWEAELDGKTVLTRSGKIGGKAREQRRAHTRGYKAHDHYRRLIRAKLREGFQRVIPGRPTPEPAAARNPELEALIVEDADDAETYLVYADWLQRRGDPRGELIAVQHRQLSSPGSVELQEEVLRLRAPYDAQLRQLGEAHELGLPPGEAHRIRVSWQLGFIRSARIAHDWFEREDGDTDVGELFDDFLGLPSARLIQELTVGLLRDADGQAEYGDVIDALVKHRPPALRRLFIADFRFPDQMEMSWTVLGDLSSLYGAVPRLRELILQGANIKLGAVDLPELRSFELRTGGLAKEDIRSICSARWPLLERLVVWFGDPYYGGEGEIGDIGPILAGDGIERVEHLGLMNAQFTDAICAALGEAPVLERLRSIDLSMGTMTDEGAADLAEISGRLARLELIDLSDNYLTDRARELLRPLGDRVRFGKQRVPDEWDGELRRFASVGE